MPIDDANWQNISTVQSKLQPAPVTIAAAAALNIKTFLTIITGTTAVATINPPVSGTHLLAIVTAATNFSGFTTTGNILVASVTNSTGWANTATLLVYNPTTQKYHPTYPVS